MSRTYRVICASSEANVIFTAQRDGWTVLNPVRPMHGLDSEDDGQINWLNGFNGLLTHDRGWVALCYKDL